MMNARVSFSARILAVAAAALVTLSGCTAPTTTAEPTSTPSASSDWQQVALQENADELWDKVLRQFPDASRPDVEFVEWSIQNNTGGMDRLIDCLNESSQSPEEENTMAGYACRVQFPVRSEFPTNEADLKP
jgi:hypothetical protein